GGSWATESYGFFLAAHPGQSKGRAFTSPSSQHIATTTAYPARLLPEAPVPEGPDANEAAGRSGGELRLRFSCPYFPDWLLQPRRRAEQAFVSVIADAYLAGVSTRRVEKLVQQLGVERLSKSQVSRLAKSLDELV